jgi:hypothetical protein
VDAIVDTHLSRRLSDFSKSFDVDGDAFGVPATVVALVVADEMG